MSHNPICRWDRESAWVAVLAACASLFSFLAYFHGNDILLFGDAVAHINIARKVFDSRTPGLLQLGTVWLPLPHLLMIPCLANDWAWQTGVGGSIPSLIAYVFATVGIFRLTRNSLRASERLHPWAHRTGWFAAAALGANPNLLYLQTTAMTESLYLALFIWATVHFSEFAQSAEGAAEEASGSPGTSLGKCGFCLAGACLTRYDGWFVAVAAAGAAIVVTRRVPARRKELQPMVVKFVLLAAAAPALWFIYNGMVYRNPLEFENGPYSAKAIERKSLVAGLPPHPGTDNLAVAALYVLKAGESNLAEAQWLQRAWLLLSVLGAALVLREKRIWPLLLLWVPLGFYMAAVAYGGVPIFTPAWWPFSLYNVRYGVQLLPALAVFSALAIAGLASLMSQRREQNTIFSLAMLLGLASYGQVWASQPVSFREAWVNSRTRLPLEHQLAEVLRQLPKRSTLLMYLAQHVGALQDAGIPLRQVIHEGNHRVWVQPTDPQGLWERALADPAGYADYVVAFPDDPVWQAVRDRNLPVVARVEAAGQQSAAVYLARARQP
ncbi:MAG TPA: hypothetical protein VEI01_13335 [Terriglobales bacterium]|nr:hypothetical protein [Terriglobales bacterium]